ncbi:MAG: tripartite tricarboxylate transporter family receptor [Hyphomicrobiales bacterium]|nr:tripartite tricarboxylate transporter family receptor [Hyphomicrobiales bacterium]
MSWFPTRRAVAFCTALATLSPGAVLAQAPSVEAFYKGKTIELYVGTDPGGGYDLYARLIARYLGRHMPGTPSIVVKNMPGAGHLRMANWVYGAAPRDGTVIAAAPQSVAIEQVLGTEGVQYDARQFTWIGRVAPVVEVTYTWHTSPTKTLDDARRRETIMGGSGVASPTVFYLNALNQLAGTKFNVIPAFPSNAETNLAMQRGEVEGGSKAWASMKVDNAEWLRDGKVNILVQYATSRDKDLPNVPLMMELGRNEDERRALNLFAMGNAMGRSIMATPGIPADRIAALRKAFADTMSDPELIAFTREKKIDFGPTLTGEELQKLIEETLALPPHVIALAKKARSG